MSLSTLQRDIADALCSHRDIAVLQGNGSHRVIEHLSKEVGFILAEHYENSFTVADHSEFLNRCNGKEHITK